MNGMGLAMRGSRSIRHCRQTARGAKGSPRHPKRCCAATPSPSGAPVTQRPSCAARSCWRATSSTSPARRDLDPSEFPQPGAFDMKRENNVHVAFGSVRTAASARTLRGSRFRCSTRDAGWAARFRLDPPIRRLARRSCDRPRNRAPGLERLMTWQRRASASIARTARSGPGDRRQALHRQVQRLRRLHPPAARDLPALPVRKRRAARGGGTGWVDTYTINHHKWAPDMRCPSSSRGSRSTTRRGSISPPTWSLPGRRGRHRRQGPRGVRGADGIW